MTGFRSLNGLIINDTTIKYEYRQIEFEMNKLINGISDEAINKAFNF